MKTMVTGHNAGQRSERLAIFCSEDCSTMRVQPSEEPRSKENCQDFRPTILSKHYRNLLGYYIEP